MVAARRGFFGLSFLVACLLAVMSSAVSAQSTPLPAPYMLRPLSLPVGTLRVDGELQVHSYVLPGDRAEQWSMYGAVAAGFTPDLELGALLLPIAISPTSDFVDPYFYGVYTLHRGDVEYGLYATLNLPVQGDFEVQGGIPLILRFGNLLRINTGGFLGFRFSNPVQPSVEVPVQAAFQVTPRVFLGPELGVCFSSGAEWWRPPQLANTCVGQPGRDFGDVAVPFGAFGGYTFVRDSGAPLADLRMAFRSLDVGNGMDQWLLTAGANFFFSL